MDNDRTTMIGGAAGAVSTASAENCPACTADVPAGEDFCPKCGYQRGTWKGRAASSDGAGADAPGAPPTPLQSGPVIWELQGADGAAQPLAAGTYVLGRGEVDIRIDDSFASRRHAQLEVSADKVTLTDLASSNGTFIGADRLSPNEPRELAGGATFKLASTEFTLSKVGREEAVQRESAEPEGTSVMDASAQPAAETDAEGTAIDASSQVEPGKEGHTPEVDSQSHWELRREGGEPLAISFGETVLGRKADAATLLVEGDSYVSGRHCRLIATEHTLEVTDLRSTNGSFVNDARLEPEQPWQLADGDKLRIGQTSFAVANNKPAITLGQEVEQQEEAHAED